MLSVALSNPYNPFPAKKLSGEKCMSWTSAIDLGLVKEIKTKTGKFLLCLMRQFYAMWRLSEREREDINDNTILITKRKVYSVVANKNLVPVLSS